MTELEMVTGGAETPFGIGMPTQTRSPILDGALLNPLDLPAGNPA